MLLFIQPETLTPYILALLAMFTAGAAWLLREVISQGRDLAAIKYYIERQTKDAAIRLEQLSNPTPPEKQKLLQKYRLDIISREECAELITWLETLGTNPDVDSAERSAALQILTGVKTSALLRPNKKRWSWGMSV